MVMVNIPAEVIDDLRILMEILDHAAKQHIVCDDDEQLIDFWTPIDSDQEIQCPDLTVGLLRKTQQIKAKLRL